MKFSLRLSAFSFFSIFSFHLSAQTNVAEMAAYRNLIKTLYTDVHGLEPCKVKYEAVAEAHKKDPAVQQKYGVYEEKGLVYCLSSLKDTTTILKTHAGAHGMLPAHIYPVRYANHPITQSRNRQFDFSSAFFLIFCIFWAAQKSNQCEPSC